MSEIRTTKIDGVEFVTYKDYLRLKAEKQELEYLGDINEELKEENKKLKEDNQKLREQIIQQNRCYEQQFENGFPKYELLNHKQ